MITEWTEYKYFLHSVKLAKNIKIQFLKNDKNEIYSSTVFLVLAFKYRWMPKEVFFREMDI